MNSAASQNLDPRVAFFDQLAPRWDLECSHPDQTLCRLAELNGQLGLAPGQDLLEVGCGTGQITAWLAQAVAPGRILGVDFSAGMLTEARRKNPSADFDLLDICVEEPPRGAFDVALCFNAFPHFRDPSAALRHIAISLRPGGSMLILHLLGSAELNAFHGKLDGPVHHDLLPPANRWPALLQASRLCLVSVVDRPDLFLLKASVA